MLGGWLFRGLDLLVDPRVVIPRPETEVTAQVAIDEAVRLGARRGRSDPWSGAATTYSIADLGTGSGALALALASELPDAEVWGTDVSDDALAVARANLAGTGHYLVATSWTQLLLYSLVGLLLFGLSVVEPLSLETLRGYVLASFMGRSVWQVVERAFFRLPFIKAVYPHVKQVTDLLLAEKKMDVSAVVAELSGHVSHRPVGSPFDRAGAFARSQQRKWRLQSSRWPGSRFTTLQDASPSAIARPMPREPPVMRPVLPRSELCMGGTSQE